MAAYHMGQKVRIVEGIEGSRIGGFPCEIFQADEAKNEYMVVYHDTAVLGGETSGVYFWMSGDNLEEAEETEDE